MKKFLLLFIITVILASSFGVLVEHAQQGQTSGILSNPLGGQITTSGSSCSTVGACVWMKLPPGAATANISVTGSWTATLIVEVAADGANFTPSIVPATATGQGVINSTGIVSVPASGYTDVRVRASSLSSGIVLITINASVAPFHALLYAVPSGGQTAGQLTYSNPATPNFTVGSEAGQPGLGTRNPGVEWFMAGQTLTASGNNGTMFNLVDSFMSQSCWAELESNAGTGTTPTLNVYVQDSAGDGVWNDRISFLQVTNAASVRQIAGITAAASLAPVAATDGTLTAGSIVNGPFSPWMRVRWIITGTTPSFTGVTVVVFCS